MVESNYDEDGIHDRVNLLSEVYHDSISISIDTVSEYRDWDIVLDIVDANCQPEEQFFINFRGNVDSIQVLVYVDTTENGSVEGLKVRVNTTDTIKKKIGIPFIEYIENFFSNNVWSTIEADTSVLELINAFIIPPKGSPLYRNLVIHPVTWGNINPVGGKYGCRRRNNSGSCTSNFSVTYGGGTHNFTNKDKFHAGVDIRAPLNTDVFAMFDGQIEAIVDTFAAGEYAASSYGNYVVIRHSRLQHGGTGGGWVESKYTHLNSVSQLSIGDRITQGTKIGESGNTGNAAAIPAHTYHTHIYMRDAGGRIDPSSFLKHLELNYNNEKNY